MKIPEFEIYRLIVFYYVAKERSITAAADKLFLTQPAVTSHVKTLEKLTGLKLIEIKKQRIALTPAGEGLYQYAKEIYEQSVLAGRYVELMRNSSLNIGITPLFNSIVAPLLKTMFDDLFPQVNINVESKESPYLISDVLDSSIDLAVIATSGYLEPKLKYTTMVDQIELVFYASPNNPIFKKDKIRWGDLYGYPVITGSETSMLRQFIVDKMKLDGLNPDGRSGLSIVSNTDLNKRLVKNGNFLGITLQADIEDDLKIDKLRIVNFPDDIKIGVVIVTYPNTYNTPMIRKFISLAENAFHSFRYTS